MHTRDEVCNALDGNFKLLMDCLGQLTEEELTTCQVVGKWTVKDVVAHVGSWSDEAVRTVKAWQGARPWQQGVKYDDAWNEEQVTAKEILPLITVVDGVTGAHRRLMHLLDLASDESLAAVARAPWGAELTLLDFFWEMADHYREHVMDLSSYQTRCLGSVP
jgi:hypothetical protein